MRPVLSMNPAVEGDIFHWARTTWSRDLVDLLRNCRAVVLPQTVQRELYALCTTHCPKVFPNYNVRFQWQGKIGDTLLFWTHDLPHPKTLIFPKVETLQGEHPEMGHIPRLPDFPFVLKATRGGEGRHTWLISDDQQLEETLRVLEQLEWHGSSGFVVQEYLPGLDRDLRVVVIGDRIESYWRCSPGNFHHNLAREGEIDRDSDPRLQEAGRRAVRDLCRRTGINLAGFDLVFPADPGHPLFLEINYTFGRGGLGGNDAFCRMLNHAVSDWLARPPAGTST